MPALVVSVRVVKRCRLTVSNCVRSTRSKENHGTGPRGPEDALDDCVGIVHGPISVVMATERLGKRVVDVRCGRGDARTQLGWVKAESGRSRGGPADNILGVQAREVRCTHS